MSRTLIPTVLLAVLAMNTKAQITNGGFENWTTQFVYENPDIWQTGNGQFFNYVQTTKVTTGAPDGNYAVRLESTVNGPDTAFGFVIMGGFDNDVPSNGAPFTTSISYINAQLRYNIQPGDTAIMLFTAWQGGGVASAQVIKIAGTQPTWTNWDYFLDTPVQFVDSVMLAVASSDPFTGSIVDGSWIEVDNVMLLEPTVLNPDLLPNNSFENWTDVNVEDPDDWTSYNIFTQAFGVTSVAKSTDAFAGNFSAQISTMGVNSDTLAGILTNGDLVQGNFTGGVPYTAFPTLFTAQYKYTPAGADSAFIAIYFRGGGAVVGVVGSVITSNTTTWTPIMENIVIGGVPDTLQIVIFSGQNPGSTLLIDELDLSGGTVTVHENLGAELNVFPSPANDLIHVTNLKQSSSQHLRIVNMNGGEMAVGQSSAAGNVTTLGIDHLPAGAYLLEVTAEGKTIMKRFVKQ